MSTEQEKLSGCCSNQHVKIIANQWWWTQEIPSAYPMYRHVSFIVIYHHLPLSTPIIYCVFLHNYPYILYIYNIIIIIIIIIVIIIVIINQLLWYVQYIYCMNSSSPPGALQSSPQCPRSDQRAPLRIPSPEEPATAPGNVFGVAAATPHDWFHQKKGPEVLWWNGETVKRNKACLKSKSRRGPHHSCSRCASPYQSLVKFSADWQRSNPGLHKNPCGLVQ